MFKINNLKNKTSLDQIQIQCIDGLRATAILMVIVQHYKTIFWGPGGVLALLTTPGASGVILFFVLSGLCISLSKSYEKSWIAFYVVRLFRIVPACWVCMATFLGIDHFILQDRISINDLFGTFLMLPNQFQSVLDMNPSLWSLQTEIELYLLFPASIFIFNKLNQSKLLIISLIVTVSAYLAWSLSTKTFTYFPPFPALCHWLIWNMGLILAFKNFSTQDREIKNQLWQSLIFIFLGAVTLIIRNYSQSNIFAFWYLFSGYGFFLFTNWVLVAKPKVLSNKIMSFIGKRSYSLYLIHVPLAVIFKNYIEYRPMSFIITIITVLLFTEISYKLIEIPFHKQGKQLALRFE